MEDVAEKVRKEESGFSRRGFIKGLLAGAGLVTVGVHKALGQMAGGAAKAQPVRGWGVPEGLVKLNGNENPIGPSPRVVEAILQHAYGVNRYAQTQDIYAKIAKLHGLPVVTPTSPFGAPAGAWVTLGAGSSEVLYAIASAYLRQGGETIEATPGYGNISTLGQGWGCTPKWIPVTKDWQHDLSAMKKAITRNTRMIIITQPGNPTGILVPVAELKKFVEEVSPSIMIFLDEAYIDFARKAEDRVGGAYLIKDHPNVIVARTFSKIYGMAGMAIGYGLAQPKVIDELNRNKGGRPSMLAVHAAEAALDDIEYQERAREVHNAGKEYLAQRFKEMGIEYVPSESSFMLVNVKKNSDEVCKRLEAEYKVIVGNAFQRWQMQGWLRLSIGLPEENEAFISALKQVLTTI
ncbi:MAG: aminotransferase class I/II-fold pyridoxal phosphate-dependent enzyme [candidate division Zixibacteria bacterium]|nr:aminotransferase class I/II-fold pyridoxal phosphate-dependent enzyme [candidate division Zixibacteria bacterium]